MANSEKVKAHIANMSCPLLLTETDSPFTLSENITSRLDSLNNTIKSVSAQGRKGHDEMKKIIFENFKNILMH